jgi:hypothetical protein
LHLLAGCCSVSPPFLSFPFNRPFLCIIHHGLLLVLGQ